MSSSSWESKEISGFFWFRSELSGTIDDAELEVLMKYFMGAHDLWTLCFNKKMLGAPIFRFRQSNLDPSHLKIQMLRVKDDQQDDAIIAEKAVSMSRSGNSLSLVFQ
jgi:hypothetical protein